jgi:hypothetical protein
MYAASSRSCMKMNCHLEESAAYRLWRRFWERSRILYGHFNEIKIGVLISCSSGPQLQEDFLLVVSLIRPEHLEFQKITFLRGFMVPDLY